MCGCLSHALLQGIWPVTQARALAGNQTCDPLVCRPELNALSHNSQGPSYPILSIQLSTFTLLCSHHHHPPTKIFHLSKLEDCTH